MSKIGEVLADVTELQFAHDWQKQLILRQNYAQLTHMFLGQRWLAYGMWSAINIFGLM